MDTKGDNYIKQFTESQRNAHYLDHDDFASFLKDRGDAVQMEPSRYTSMADWMKGAN